MMNSGKLAGKTLFITGASRGIGKAIALKAAKDVNVLTAAKTIEPHTELLGNKEEAGCKAVPCVVDVQDEGKLKSAVDNAVKKFGGIDVLVNSASAISLVDTLNTDVKHYDSITSRTFLVSKTSLPQLKKSSNGHILNLSPSLNMHPLWFKHHVANTVSKCSMSMCVLGMAESDGVSANTSWPKTSNKNSTPISNLDVDTYGAIFQKHGQVKGMSQKRMMSSQAGDGGVEGIFNALKGKLNAEIVNSTQAIFQFNLTAGDKEETYHIDLRNGDGTAGKGKPSDKPDATLTMNAENFQKLFAGKLKPTAAFMTGKLKISGNMQKAMKLEKLLSSLKSKA